MSYFTRYADWANLTVRLFTTLCLDRRAYISCVVPQITQHVGQCGPVAGTVDSAAVILCSEVVNSLVSADPLTSFMHRYISIHLLFLLGSVSL